MQAGRVVGYGKRGLEENSASVADGIRFSRVGDFIIFWSSEIRADTPVFPMADRRSHAICVWWGFSVFAENSLQFSGEEN